GPAPPRAVEGLEDGGHAGSGAATPPAERKSAATTHPQRTRTSQSTAAIPEERPREVVPQQPAPVIVTIPAGTSLSVNLPEPLSSGTAVVGDRVRATLKSPLIVGDRVVFPAGSAVEGDVSDVKSAKKGFKETGGALS